jgi:threonine dehydrogenase-like Zn-dependent dehydrogenase
MLALRYTTQLLLDRSAPAPTPGPGEALIRTRRAGIASSDLAVSRGLVPFSGILGHEFAGVVERLHPEASKDDRKRWEGKRVAGSINIICGQCDLCRKGLSTHCRARKVLGLYEKDGCFAELFTLPLRNLCEIPPKVHDDQAVFAEPLAAAIHAAQMIRAEGKPYITILGDGVSGLLCAQIMARLNASVRLLGKHPEKFTLCEKWGIKHRHISEVGRRHDQDIVVDCTGSPEGLTLAQALVRPRGTIILKTTAAPVGSEETPNPHGVDLSPLVRDEVTLIGSRCGSIPDALAALASGAVDVLPLITRRAKLAEALEALRLAAAPDQIKVLLEP